MIGNWTWIDWFGNLFGILFGLFYAYQFVYLFVALFIRKKKEHKPAKQHRFGVIIAARNEEAVLPNLLDSLEKQDYPRDKFGVCIVADNCTDNTAAVCRNLGATVFERFDTEKVGKGYALDWLFHRMEEEKIAFDAYVVFDADNLLDPHFLTAMDQVLSDGYDAATSYRNSKNYGDNWVAAGNALWFLHDSQQLNLPRYILGTNCTVAGTGFAFTRELLVEMGGWPYYTLTEDLQFSAELAIRGKRIGYSQESVLYDEQPTRFGQSWRQRMRWTQGYLQVLGKYGWQLLKGFFCGKFACFDILACVTPAFALSLAGLTVNVIYLVQTLLQGGTVLAGLRPTLTMVLEPLGILFFLGAVTLITEWKNIRATTGQKIGLYLLFPLFMFTYIPVAVNALFARREWKPIAHERALSVEDMEATKQ